MQYGWLDLFGEKWLLLTGNIKSPMRSWVDKEAALAELREEGWTIAGIPTGHRSRKDSGRSKYGYIMTRTVH